MRKITRLTPKNKLRILKEMLKLFPDKHKSKLNCDGLCNAFQFTLYRLIDSITYYKIRFNTSRSAESLLEYYFGIERPISGSFYCPKVGWYWFKPYEGKPRIAIIKRAIRKLEKEIKAKQRLS